MATRTPARPKAPNPHEAVSNESGDGVAGPKKATTTAGAEGLGAPAAKPGPDGIEAVAGYQPPPEAAAADGAPRPVKLRDLGKLPDIATASYGASVESIIGVDNRVQITATNVYPWRANASLLITAADNSNWIGTGWFVGPHTLITAGHCVFIKGSGVPGRDGWVRRIVVIPGRNGNTAPYGTVTATSFRSVTGWTSSGNHEFDYGAILLPTPLGNSTGWYGFGNYPDAQLINQTVNIAGYPGDKPAGTQWYHSQKVTAVNARKVYYTVDTMGGQSGSAVYRIVNGARIAVAVHAYGGSTANSGTRINAQVYGNISAWRA
jgi:V8-like Glu-specific endopeptidase